MPIWAGGDLSDPKPGANRPIFPLADSDDRGVLCSRRDRPMHLGMRSIRPGHDEMQTARGVAPDHLRNLCLSVVPAFRDRRAAQG